MHYTRFLECMCEHEEETVLILASNQSYSTDLHLQEIVTDTFIVKKLYEGHYIKILKLVVLKTLFK